MRRRFAVVVVASGVVAVLAGYGVGSARASCEHTCPAQGPCPNPPDCAAAVFNWAGAIVMGVIVWGLVALVAIAVIRRRQE